MSGETVKSPQVRIRINHTRTARDGWKLAETTIEVDGELGANADHYTIRGLPVAGGRAFDIDPPELLGDLAQDAFAAGEAEAQRRNNADRDSALHDPDDLPSMAEVPF